LRYIKKLKYKARKEPSLSAGENKYQMD